MSRTARYSFMGARGGSGPAALPCISARIVLFGSGDDDTPRVRYVRRPFQREPDFGAASVNYALKDLLATAEDPRQGRVAVGAPERP